MNRNENELHKNNSQYNSNKESKYSDEGRDGDFNTPSSSGPAKPGADELYEDEQQTVNNPIIPKPEKKGEEESYVSYDGNGDNTPPSNK